MKKYRVIIEEDGELTPVLIEDHYLVLVQFEGEGGFISQSLYDKMLKKDVVMRELLALMGLSIPADEGD